MANHYDTGLLALPKEILVKVRSNLYCLKDYVNFSLTCTHIFRMYTRQYWKSACISAGWGITSLSLKNKAKLQHESPRYQLHTTWPWGGLARIVVKDAPFFEVMSGEGLDHLDKLPGTSKTSCTIVSSFDQLTLHSGTLHFNS